MKLLQKSKVESFEAAARHEGQANPLRYVADLRPVEFVCNYM